MLYPPTYTPKVDEARILCYNAEQIILDIGEGRCPFCF